MCPGVSSVVPAAPPPLCWLTPAALADGPDALLAGCAFAAHDSLAAPPLAPDARLTPTAEPPPDDTYWTDVVAGMARAASELQAILAAGSPYLRSWAPLVGQAHDRVLTATSAHLRRPCPARSDGRLARLRFSPRHCPPTTPPIVCTTNGTPPAGFAPTFWSRSSSPCTKRG